MLNIEIKHASLQKTIVTLEGRLDRTTASQAEEALATALATPPHQLVLDLAMLDFISSAGLRVVMLTRKQLGAAGAECLIVNMKPHVEKVFDVIKNLPALKAFKTVTELDAYLATIQQPGA